MLAIFGITAGVFAIAEIYPYTLSILGRDIFFRKIPEGERTIPSLAGFTILAVEGFIVALSYYQRQDWNDFYFFSGITIEYILAATLAIWYGEHRLVPRAGEKKNPIFSTLDIFCLAGTFASLIVWYWLGSWDIPIAINIIIDALGILAIIGKVWRLPHSEDFLAWTMTVTGCVLALLALGGTSTWTFERAGFPIYMVICNTVVWALLFRRFQKGSARSDD